jgi:hypothetical protein
LAYEKRGNQLTAKRVSKMTNDIQTTEKSLVIENQPNTDLAQVRLGTLAATSPKELVAGASEMATELAQVIQSQELFKMIQGKPHVMVEGWTTLATMLGVTAQEVSTIEEDGVYIATVELVRMSDGAVVGRASAECGSPDEKDKYGKPIWANRPRYARRSMAQTRATGKACRLAFSWIIKLAGYEATPAEEMPQGETPQEQPSVPQGNAPHTHNPHTQQKRDACPAIPRGAPINADQHKRLEARITKFGLDRERVKKWCANVFKVEHFTELDNREYNVLDEKLEEFALQAAREEAAEERKAIQEEGQ